MSNAINIIPDILIPFILTTSAVILGLFTGIKLKKRNIKKQN